jgi:1-acyl-sn-glycerol-3-phosphate acyltransferase
MSFDRRLPISRGFLWGVGTKIFVYNEDRIPPSGAAVFVSNHRSFMDAPLLMAASGRPINFVCHHYMTRVPGLREFVDAFGCLPLEPNDRPQHRFFRKALRCLRQQQAIGIFPEGASSMVQMSAANELAPFHPGFAHLALSAPVDELALIPVAIASMEETVYNPLPVRMLSWFDPSEPYFQQDGWHPIVIYRRVNLLFGRPRWISRSRRQSDRPSFDKTAIEQLNADCYGEIDRLLRRGCY